MIKLEKIKEGNVLRLSLEDGASAEELIALRDSYGSDVALTTALESYWTNGWGCFTADALGEMSNCYVICEEYTLSDDGTPILHGNAWTNIHNYQIVDPIDEIVKNGYYDFLFWACF